MYANTYKLLMRIKLPTKQLKLNVNFSTYSGNILWFISLAAIRLWLILQQKECSIKVAAFIKAIF